MSIQVLQSTAPKTRILAYAPARKANARQCGDTPKRLLFPSTRNKCSNTFSKFGSRDLTAGVWTVSPAPGPLWWSGSDV